jgi:predicted nucleotide-binding protein (sugar kinase/HSP70/actin superfamily)
MRTFIDVQIESVDESWKKSKIPLAPGVKRLIVGNSCEKGLVEDVADMREIKKGLDAAKKDNPNMVEVAARAAFKSYNPKVIADPLPKFAVTAKQKKRVELMKKRATMRIGIPRILNMYTVNPIFSAYFESLGIPAENLIYSDYTNEQLYKEGAKRGAIDPCFPSKVGIPHVHNMLMVHHKKKPLDIIFCPMIDDLPSDMKHAQSHRSCPTVASTPEAVKAAFIKEGDIFKENNVIFLDTFVNPGNPMLLAKQMYEQFVDIFGLSEEENARAVEAGLQAQSDYENKVMRAKGREVLMQLEAEDRIGIVVLGRPYHNDPGINHEIMEEFQKIGYPAFTLGSLPIDKDILEKLFGEEIKAGTIKDAMDVSDAWKNSYSENTTQKIWAAKYTARHPNLVALELSSFKCGHDAPIYTAVEETVTKSGTPYFSFKDIDENKPTGSIKIRVETISYFLKRYREDMVRNKNKQTDVDSKMREFEAKLRAELDGLMPSPPPAPYEVETPVAMNAIRQIKPE